MKKPVTIIQLIALLFCGANSIGQQTGSHKPKPVPKTQGFFMAISIYDYAELTEKGSMTYSLYNGKLTIYNNSKGSNTRNILWSVRVSDRFAEQIEHLKLDTLNESYSNRCVMTDSGNDYFIHLSHGQSRKLIRLHHYYHPVVEKLVALINSVVPKKYKLFYVSSGTKQDCTF